MMASQDAYLDSVGQAVKELGLLGRNIGASLDGQAETLDRVADKSAEANDRTAFVTRKAARQAQSSKPKKPTFVMSVAFQVRCTRWAELHFPPGMQRGTEAGAGGGRGGQGERKRDSHVTDAPQGIERSRWEERNEGEDCPQGISCDA